jgi:SAM-dependent methyltransferase
MSLESMSHPIVQEPLEESAPIAHRLAREHCREDATTGESCAWYHGFWQYMRVMKLGKISGGQTGFLVEALRAAARSGEFARVLVSGSADYSMPAHVLCAYRAEAAALELEIVDRCETPIALTRWYTERVGAPVAGHASDILDFENARPYDVVLTNSFLGYFDLTSRARLFDRWARLLRPGGKLIFTNRIRPGVGYEPVGFTAAQARVFRDTVRREAERWRERFAFDPEEVARWADAYAARFRSVPVRSSAEVLDLLRDHGFRIDHCDSVSAPGRREGGAVSGPTTDEATDFLRVVATRD